MGNTIEKKLTQAGYKLLGDDGSIEKLIITILKTKNIRYLKAIPFFTYKYNIDIRNFPKMSMELNLLFGAIMEITKRIFQELNITKSIPEHINLTPKETKRFIQTRLKMNYDEFKSEFELQLKNETKPSLFIDKQKIYAERDLQMNLSRLFTKKEKQIIGRLLNDQPISRTDYEYYSRKTKKKLNSIIGLQDFAKILHAKTPRLDPDLYYLKKKLEEFLEKNSKDEKISIIKFFTWDTDKLSISYTKKNNKYSENQLFNIIIKKIQLDDDVVLSLLHKYEKHNFR